jgi:hypothetical protein
MHSWAPWHGFLRPRTAISRLLVGRQLTPQRVSVAQPCFAVGMLEPVVGHAYGDRSDNDDPEDQEARNRRRHDCPRPQRWQWPDWCGREVFIIVHDRGLGVWCAGCGGFDVDTPSHIGRGSTTLNDAQLAGVSITPTPNQGTSDSTNGEPARQGDAGVLICRGSRSEVLYGVDLDGVAGGLLNCRVVDGSRGLFGAARRCGSGLARAVRQSEAVLGQRAFVAIEHLIDLVKSHRNLIDGVNVRRAGEGSLRACQVIACGRNRLHQIDVRGIRFIVERDPEGKASVDHVMKGLTHERAGSERTRPLCRDVFAWPSKTVVSRR